MVHTPSKRTDVLNPIRHILEKEMTPPSDHALPIINLGLGEPSKANGFTLSPEIGNAVIEAVNSEMANGYTQASGTLEARQAIAKKYGTDEHPIDPNNVFLSFGCSGSLYNSISTLCENGDNVLVPNPGFPLCQPIC